MGRFKDLTGQRFGMLTVIERADDKILPKGKHLVRWKCLCDCGNEKVMPSVYLITGDTKSCGCLGKKTRLKNIAHPADLVGQKFKKLTVIEFSHIGKQHKRYWKCRCDCGNEVTLSTSVLRANHTKSCGCYQRKHEDRTAFRGCYHQYKNNAKNRNHIFSLTEEQFREITQQNCYYCGVEPSQIYHSGSRRGKYIYNGIDRINNTKGYEVGNVVSCCGMCNQMKMGYAEIDFLAQVMRIYDRHLKPQEVVA